MTWVQAGNQNLYNDDPIYEISATNVIWLHISVTFNWQVLEVSLFMKVSFSYLDFLLYSLKGQDGWASTRFREK